MILFILYREKKSKYRVSILRFIGLARIALIRVVNNILLTSARSSHFSSLVCFEDLELVKRCHLGP
jgi:hypothetical protein